MEQCAPLPAWRGRAAATRPVRARLVRGHLSGPASPSSPSAGGARRLAGRLAPLLVAAPCGAAGHHGHNVCRLTGASWVVSTQPPVHLQLHHLHRACSAAKARGRHQQGTGRASSGSTAGSEHTNCALPELVLLRRRRGLCHSRRLALSGLLKAKRLERRGPRLPRRGTGVCQHSHAATAFNISVQKDCCWVLVAPQLAGLLPLLRP